MFDSECPVSRVVLPVSGMTCAGCVQSVERALSKIDGVIVAKARLGPDEVLVRYDAGRTELGTLRAAVREIGFEIDVQMERNDG